MPWYFHAALKQIFPSGKLLSFFAFISVTGVTLGVMVLLVVQSVMNGFVFDIQSNLAKTNGDIQIVSRAPIVGWEDWLENLEARPEVKAAAPLAHGVVMLQARNRPMFPYVWGLDLESGPEVLPFEDFLQSGTMDDLDDRSIFVSGGVARELTLGVGTEVAVYTPLMLDRMKVDEVIRPITMRVAGIFETGWNEVDSRTVVVTLRTMQELYGLGESVHGVVMKLEDGVDTAEYAGVLNAGLSEEYHAQTWMDVNSDFLFVLRLEKTMMFFIMIFIVLVASFSIAISLMMAVIRKTREIGLLSAMGASRFGIGACFCLQGFLIGTVGTILGIIGALVALHFRNNIFHLFAHLTGRGQALTDAYGFSYLPAHYIISDFIIVALFSIFVSTLAGLIPAWRAARVQPAEALRNDA